MANEAVTYRTFGNRVALNPNEAIAGGHTGFGADDEQEDSLMANGGPPTREEIDAKLDAVQERLYRRLDRIEEKLDNRPNFIQMLLMIIGGIGIAVAIMAYASDRFDGGLAASSLLDQVRKEQQVRDAKQDKDFGDMRKLLEQIRDKSQGSPAQGQN